MNERSIRTLARIQPLKGSPILRPFPSEAIPSLDPFVFLDTGAPQRMGDREIVVAPHPHRGVVPISLPFSASIAHRDSLGVEHQLESGGIQWLVSGRGALHEERLRAGEDSMFHMAQLWLNLPNELKMIEPEHHALPAADIPTIDVEGAALRLFAGTFGDTQSPATFPVPVFIAHATLEPGSVLEIPVQRGWNVGVVCTSGSLDAPNHDPLVAGDTLTFEDDGASVVVRSSAGGQALIMAGEPLGEPVFMGGGFVMSSAEELEAAFDEYHAGGFGQLEAS